MQSGKSGTYLKSETSLLCNSYRPISLISNIGKIMEKMHQRLNFFLEQCNCSYSFQFGFRSNYSANSALISIVENTQMQLNNREFAAGVFVELGKAFGTADCRILLQKLEDYGVRGISGKCLGSYLTNGKQFVSIDNYNSTTKTILAGVPKGSVLGPLLFLICINALHKCVKYSKVYHFVDDTNNLQFGKSLNILAKKLNQDLKSLSQWLKAKLSSNVKKTALIISLRKAANIDYDIRFKLDGKRLTSVNTVKYLGILLDEHLQSSKQLSYVQVKLDRGIGFLSKLRHNRYDV